MIAPLLIALLSAPAGDLDAFLEKFQEKRAGIAVLEATFHRVNITEDEAFEVEGTLLYAKPRRVVFRHADEETPDVLIDGLRLYTTTDREMEQLDITDLEDDPKTEALFVGFEHDVKRLRKAYDLTLFDPQGKARAVQGMELRPKEDDGESGMFRSIRLYLREEDYLPVFVEIDQEGGARVEIRIHEYRINQPVDPKKTQFLVPEGTVIVENEESFEEAGPGGKWVPEKPIETNATSTEPETP